MIQLGDYATSIFHHFRDGTLDEQPICSDENLLAGLTLEGMAEFLIEYAGKDPDDEYHILFFPVAAIIPHCAEWLELRLADLATS